MARISVISPVYGAENIVDTLVQRIEKNLKLCTDDYEIILVEDGSPDNSWEKIEAICTKNPHVKGIKLSRNFGQHYAICAGIFHTTGKYNIIMDCDLQDNPKYISQLVEEAEKGAEVVYTIKKKRKHNPIKDLFAFLFHVIFNKMIGNKGIFSHRNIGSYSLITDKVVEGYKKINDYYRPYLIILQWLGFNYSHITIEHAAREEGKSSYSFKKLVIHALNGLISQTDKILWWSIYMGFSFLIFGFSFLCYIFYTHLTNGFAPGWTSIITAIIFCSGLILLSQGIIGVYLSKVFIQTKNRPFYLVGEKLNFK